MIHKTLLLLSIFTLLSCSKNIAIEKNKIKKPTPKVAEQHSYGGWYCPDNLRGFPAVDIKDWENVPVVNGRMATKEETQNGTSLIFVDKDKFPNAKPLDIKMPKLARFYNHSSRKDEIVIVIQALNISNDSIVGFRYLNGGNGSARLKEVTFLSDKEIKNTTASQFVTLNIPINATSNNIWKVLTKPEYLKDLKPIFDTQNSLKMNLNTSEKVNFKYSNAGAITKEFADDLFGNKYIQIDFEQGDYQYVEKFLVIEDSVTKQTTLQIVCGPYKDDFKFQKDILKKWSQKVKTVSEAIK